MFALLQNNPTVKNFDAIIISGGLGGLVCGAKLAKEGKRALLLEQHIVVGGCATTFRRKDFSIDVELQQMGGLDNLDPKKEIFT